MTQTRISSSLAASDVIAAMSAFADIAAAIDGSRILKTKPKGRAKRGVPTPPEKLIAFWYVKGESTVVLHHDSRTQITLTHESPHGTREISLENVLQKVVAPKDCLDVEHVAKAISNLSAVLIDVPIANDVSRIAEFAEICAEMRPDTINRSIRFSAPTPFAHAILRGYNREGKIVAKETPSARKFALETLGRSVLLEASHSRPSAWKISRPGTSAMSRSPDPIARLRLLSQVPQPIDPLFILS